jgi:hypothetical protein
VDHCINKEYMTIDKGELLRFNDMEVMAFNTRVPVHPLPDITLYNPDDYTDVKKHSE